MTSFFYFLSHRGIWIVSAVSLLVSILTYLIFDGLFIRHMAISFGYGFSCYSANLIVRSLYPYWSQLRYSLIASMIGISIGSVNAYLWIKGYGFGEEWLRFLPIVALAVLFSGAGSFMFYLQGQAVSLESELMKNQLIRQDLERRLALSELELLQSQVDPKFLYHTLTDIRQLIATDPDLAAHLTTRLTDLLRVSMPLSYDKCTTLTNEVALLDTYLSIHELRSQGGFSYSIEIDDGVSPHYVLPPNLIQSIVEHAVLHGDLEQSTPRDLSVAFRRETDQLEVLVIDNGTGLGALLEQEGSQSLKQIQGRLTQLFGEKGSFEIFKQDQGQTSIRLAWHYEG
ncbi:sensor histidine kinase [Thaumasiovibrio subtropicus]|uniref:sensor histidine kinase n=1 Tax=Thaumasiovibrio subtropicus TaxID=1891207 RepID=UPI000B352909|nr:histidine kinase [Thaumasiovibrio subtropicus]